VTLLVKDNIPGQITLAIGDGANDVSMIQVPETERGDATHTHPPHSPTLTPPVPRSSECGLPVEYGGCGVCGCSQYGMGGVSSMSVVSIYWVEWVRVE
jgi:hypothetical protein